MHPQGRVASAAGRPNAGIDVAKSHLDGAWLDHTLRVENTATGWSELIAKLQADEVDLVVVEASGGYERGLVCALHAAGVVVARVNPRQARDFAKSLGVLAKSDRLDARVLRDFADMLARHDKRAQYITVPLQPQRQALAQMVTRRRQLVEMRVAESNRLEHADARAQRSIHAVIKALDKQLGRLDGDIDAHLDKHFKEQAQLLDSVKGIGPVTIMSLTALMPELGKVNRRAAAKLVGLAPMIRESGRYKGSRHIVGGRGALRAVIYMATVSAMSHNDAIRTFAQRLRAAGKPPKVVIVACMRKLLVIVNAMMRDQKTYDAARHLGPKTG